jgi:hypothetical protein
MLIKWIISLNRIQQIALFIIMLLITGGIIKSIYFSESYWGIDLRNRVVGARLLDTPHSPYFYKWKPGDPEHFADPGAARFTFLANALTVTPGFLYFQSLFSWMDFPVIRTVWNIMQYLVGISILAFVIGRKGSSTMNQLYVIGIAGVFFFCTDIWFFNIAAGQAYILFAGSMCMLLYLISSGKAPAAALAGILVALVSYARPNFILFAAPLLFLSDRHFMVALMSSGILLLIHAYINLPLWQDYFEAMSMHSGLHPGPSLLPQVVYYPDLIEGAADSERIYVPGLAGIPTLRWTFISAGIHNRYVYLILYAIVMIFTCWFFRKVIRKKEPLSLSLIGFLLYIISEIFLPSIRGGYTLVQWIFPVALMLHSRKVTADQILLLVTGLCLVNGFPFELRFTRPAGETLLLITLAGFIRKSQGSPLSSGTAETRVTAWAKPV